MVLGWPDVVLGVVALVILLRPAELVLAHVAGLVLRPQVVHHQFEMLECAGAVRALVAMQGPDVLTQQTLSLQVHGTVGTLDFMALFQMLL